MRRFLLPLLAALALPTAVNAEVSSEVYKLCKDDADFMRCVWLKKKEAMDPKLFQINSSEEEGSKENKKIISKGRWVTVFDDPRYKEMGQRSIDLNSLLLTKDGITIYGLRQESIIPDIGKLYNWTQWEGIDCNTKEKLSGRYGRIAIKDASKMTKREIKKSLFDVSTLWKKYSYVCQNGISKKETWKTSSEILSTDHPHSKAIYRFQLKQLGLSYKEAQEVYSKKCREKDDYKKCMQKYGLW